MQLAGFHPLPRIILEYRQVLRDEQRDELLFVSVSLFVCLSISVCLCLSPFLSLVYENERFCGEFTITHKHRRIVKTKMVRHNSIITHTHTCIPYPYITAYGKSHVLHVKSTCSTCLKHMYCMCMYIESTCTACAMPISTCTVSVPYANIHIYSVCVCVSDVFHSFKALRQNIDWTISFQ